MIPDLYRVATYALACVLLVGFGYYQGKQPYFKLKAEVAALAKVAEERAEAERQARNAITEKREAEHATAIADLSADVDRLRNRPGGDLLPPATGSPDRVDLACFDRAELGQALRAYREGVIGLLAEGSEAAVGLDTARRWWAEQQDIRP